MRHSRIWPEICLQSKLEFAGYVDSRLSRKYSEPEEHIRLMFYHEVFHGFLMQQETKIFVALNTTEAEYVPLSVQSSMASQDFDRS
jgi:hypothetical protein